MTTTGPTRGGGQGLAASGGAAAYWPRWRVIQLGPRPRRDCAGQLVRRRGERGGEGAPGAYPKYSRSDS
jgi:hypothetical protein